MRQKNSQNVSFSTVIKRESSHLQVSDVEGFFVDVGGVGACGQPAHAGQIAAVTPHGLNDKHAPLGSAGRLLDAVTSLTHTPHTLFTI